MSKTPQAPQNLHYLAAILDLHGRAVAYETGRGERRALLRWRTVHEDVARKLHAKIPGSRLSSYQSRRDANARRTWVWELQRREDLSAVLFELPLLLANRRLAYECDVMHAYLANPTQRNWDRLRKATA